MSLIENCFYRISVKALILDSEQRFLLTQEDNGLWELPGGGLNFGEKPQEGLAREIQEEMNIEVTYIAENPSYFLTAKNKAGIYCANILYLAKIKSFNFTKSAECVAIKFFTKEEAAAEKLFPNVRDFAELYNPDNHR
ncbi:MAG: NUDIX hydrolase [bacterium]|nr:NUDIX hydrolase [bacterium]